MYAKFLLTMTILGATLPLSQFLPWVADKGLDIPLFFQALFANPISSFFALDVILSALVLLAFIWVEGRRSNMTKLWLPTIITLSIGVSCALPLFLWMREKQRQAL